MRQLVKVMLSRAWPSCNHLDSSVGKQRNIPAQGSVQALHGTPAFREVAATALCVLLGFVHLQHHQTYLQS